MGERSSWLTSDAKRASRSIRSWTASAMSLNDVTSRSRSGSLLGLEPGVEAARGQLAGGVGDARDRPQQAAAGRPADRGGQDGGDRAAEHQRAADDPQAADERGEREDLEVLHVELGHVDADGEVRLAAEDEALAAGVAVEHVLAQRGREVAEAEAVALAEPAVVAVEVVQREAAVVRPHLEDDLVRAQPLIAQQLPQDAGVDEGLAQGDVLPLVGELPAGQGEREEGQRGREEQPGQEEQHGDACPHAERSTARTAGAGHMTSLAHQARSYHCTRRHHRTPQRTFRWDARGRKASHRAARTQHHGRGV